MIFPLGANKIPEMCGCVYRMAQTVEDIIGIVAILVIGIVQLISRKSSTPTDWAHIDVESMNSQKNYGLPLLDHNFKLIIMDHHVV